MSKQLCETLMSKIEDFKTNEDFNENVYMEISQDLVEIYNKIESDEYITLYYVDSGLRFIDDTETLKVENSSKSFKITNESHFLSINTNDLFEVIHHGVAINRELVNEIKEDIENPIKNYSYTTWANGVSISITVHKTKEL